MKKVLIVANLFHSSPRVSGMAKYLSDFGWDVTALTVPMEKISKDHLTFSSNNSEKFRIIETPYSGDIFYFWRKVFKLFNFNTDKSILNQTKEKAGVSSQKSLIDYIFKSYRTVFAYPDEEKNWKNPALKTGKELLEKEKFTAVISSSAPATAHIIAKELKKKFNLYWIADLRDLWTQNNDYPYFSLRRIFEKRLELKTLASADALVTVSLPLARKLKDLHKKKDVYAIINGFDPEKVNNPPCSLTPKFTITYTGQLYIGRRDPEKFLIALSQLISEGVINKNDLEVRFFGPETAWLAKKIEDYNLSNVVKQYGKDVRENALKKQRESQILLLLHWREKKSEGVYTGKIFEYLASRRPILATEGGYKDNVVRELLEKTGAGVSGNDIGEIKNLIKKFYLEYKGKGEVSYRGNWSKVEKYNQKEMARHFADILNKYCN